MANEGLFGVHGAALSLRSQRLSMLASNIANAATPNDTTEVNSDVRRNEAFIMVTRTGSSCASSAYVLPPEILRAWCWMMSACTYAVNGPATVWPWNAIASSGTVMFSARS